LNRLLPALVGLLVLSGCGISYIAPKPTPAPVTVPTLAPSYPASRGEAAGNVACPTTIGNAGGYSLFGALAPAFNAGHGGSSPLLRCATDGKVIVVQLDISPPSATASALATAKRLLPADLTPVYDKTDANCRSLQFQSKILAGVLGSDDPDGVVNIELESALATGFAYDPEQVDTAVIHQQYELNQTRPCLRG
jgi:hypothetical protein